MTALATRTKLWRYNYGILTGTGYWIIVLPVAASQIVTLWMMAMTGAFGQSVATQIAELMAPILGAFLVAHSMAPEYRSGVGAVLASKPVSLHRVVTIRVGLAMLAALFLTWATLGICSVGIAPISIWQPLLACLPSLWFLSMLALTFATLFRNALAGFAAAACLWALNLVVGYSVHPYLALQGLYAKLDSEPLASLWVPNKIALILAGLVLLWVHGRLLPRICRPPEARDVVKMAATIAAVLVLYCFTGAAATIAFAHQNRGSLHTGDVTWLRRQLRTYGPVPVARFFGPAFVTYVSEPPAGRDDASPLQIRLRQLEQALERWPKSVWADSIAYALAQEQEATDTVAAAEDYLQVADRFAQSPFAPKALARVVSLKEHGVPEASRTFAARRLLADYPRTREAERGADVLRERYPEETRREEMIAAARVAAGAAPRYRRPTWLMIVAQLEMEAGNRATAVEAAQQALTLGRAMREEDAKFALNSEVRPHLALIDGAIRDAEEMIAGGQSGN